MIDKKIDFSSKFKTANIISVIFFILSIIFIFLKGLNYGIDFKGGTLIELRAESTKVGISQIRSTLSSMNLGDVNVKEFGKSGDFLIKVEQKAESNKQLISIIKKNLVEKLNAEINFRRVEVVGPKVSAELLQSGIIAISFLIQLILFFFEPIPKTYEDAEGMYYGIGIGSQIFCGAICFLLAAIPLMVNNAHLEPVRLDHTSQPDWGDGDQF